eukprot:INCI5144.1.p2 GENE.INCI5144.1~~INCI5144.1.p2  ORF type:complete len:152 (+),score=27.01 INCI5144.1:287-742(+)
MARRRRLMFVLAALLVPLDVMVMAAGGIPTDPSTAVSEATVWGRFETALQKQQEIIERLEAKAERQQAGILELRAKTRQLRADLQKQDPTDNSNGIASGEVRGHATARRRSLATCHCILGTTFVGGRRVQLLRRHGSCRAQRGRPTRSVQQ